MAKQSLVWTVLPGGFTEDKKSLRVSLLLSPRLEPQGEPEALATFPDFFADSADWTTSLAKTKFILHFGGSSVSIAGDDFTGKNRLDDRLGKPESKVWRALFSAKTVVRDYQFNDPSQKLVLSYPAKAMDDLVSNLYRSLAVSAQDHLPTAAQILADPVWGVLVNAVAKNDRRFTDQKNGLRDPKSQFNFFADGGYKNTQDLERNLGLFELFHTPPSTPLVDSYNVLPGDPRSLARWRGYKRTSLPKPDDFRDEIDFHKIVAAMGQYPTLLRKLGLVIDLIVDRKAWSYSPNAPFSAEVILPDNAGTVIRTQDTSPRTRTRYDANHFQALPRPNPAAGDYRIVDGLLDLDPKQFNLIQADPDGAVLKVMNFARTLFQLKQNPDKAQDPISKQEREYGAPVIRNAGLMLVHDQRGAMLKNSMNRQKKYNDAAQLIQNGAAVSPPELYIEDLVRGYRVDVWDGTTEIWRSLCLRAADYDLNAGQIVLNIPVEEGTIKLAATASSDPSSNPNLLWLHEAVLSWTGWSLCAPQPGRTIHHHRAANPKKDHIDQVVDAEVEVPPGLNLRTEFKAKKGSLPRLRYGRSYWIRARAVDLAGNSRDPSPENIASENPSKYARPYYRYEPIPAPSLALVKPKPDEIEAPAEGESMERLAVRTFNDKPAQNSIPSIQHARRFIVPSRTTEKEAEYHGMFDRKGQVDASFFATITARDNSLAEEKILSAGPLDTKGLVEAGYAVLQEGDELPYLPDPLAVTIAARIFDLPGFSPNKIIPIPLYTTEVEWPNALPFKIELLEDPNDQPHFDSVKRTLFIPLGKAERATLRLSVRPTSDALALLGVWQWLTPAQQAALKKMALNGQHWMLTPWRQIDLVHAVQKPLIKPNIQKISVTRPFAATFALPSFVATCSIKSTDHLDVLAAWNEPSEDTSQKSGANVARTDHAFAVKITTPKTYAGAAEYQLEGPDLIRAGGVFHDLVQKKMHHFNDTRYRRIEYHLDATTQFREFMPANVLTGIVDGKPGATDKNIKVEGPNTRTWIPNSAPPPAPEVLYVVPTFGWVRSKDAEKQTSWRRGGGLRVYLNRPWNASGYGEMLGVVLPSTSFNGDPSVKPVSQPLKNFVTQWGNDPIWESPFVDGATPQQNHFPLARTAPEISGNWLPDFAPKEEADQPPGPFSVTNLQHPQILNAKRVQVAPHDVFYIEEADQPSGPFSGPNLQHLQILTANNSQMRVQVAPHDVFYDEERQLWYSDIEINLGRAYFPFIRLALTRYQPVSVEGAHLSHIVLADFMQLVPDRWLNVTRMSDPRVRHVNVFGNTFSDSSSHKEAKNAPAKSINLSDGTTRTIQAPAMAASSIVEVWVERLHPELGEDFGWQRDPDVEIKRDQAPSKKKNPVVKKVQLNKLRTQAKAYLRQRNFDALVSEGLIDKLNLFTPKLWSGSVSLPQALEEDAQLRLVIAEYEEYLVDEERPYDDEIPTRKDRRLVFVEHVKLE